MSKNDVLEYLKKNYDKLTDNQKIIGKYVIDNYREVAFLSAAELGERVGVSDATVIRFARSIGFSGFTEFKDSIRESIKNVDSPDVRLLKSWDSIKNKNDLILKIGKADLRNLEGFLLNIEVDKINQSVEEIYNADTIYLVGMGSSMVVAEFLGWHLKRMGFRVDPIRGGGLTLIENLAAITKKDLLIVCTFRRYSKDTYNSIVLAKKRGAKVLTITDSNLTDISINSDIVFSVAAENSSFFNSYVVPMMLCNILLMSVLEKDRDKIYGIIKDYTKSMEAFDLFV